MIVEEQISINVSKQHIFEIYQDVENWNRWDPDTKSSQLDGPFQVGTEGKIVPTKGMGIPMKVTSMVSNESFTVEGWIPMFRMVFDHELSSDGDATRVVHRVSFHGPLRFIFGRIVGAQVREGLPKTMISLKKHAESTYKV